MAVTEIRKLKLSKDKSIRVREENKVKLISFAPYIGTMIFLGLWVVLCYNTNMYLAEALICSSIVVGSVFFKFLDRENAIDVQIEKPN